MTSMPSDDQVDAALTAFLDDLARDTADAPSTAEIGQVSLGSATTRRSSQRWQLLIAVGLVIAVAISAIVVGAQREDRRLDTSPVQVPSDAAPQPPSPAPRADGWTSTRSRSSRRMRWRPRPGQVLVHAWTAAPRRRRSSGWLAAHGRSSSRATEGGAPVKLRTWDGGRSCKSTGGLSANRRIDRWSCSPSPSPVPWLRCAAASSTCCPRPATMSNHLPRRGRLIGQAVGFSPDGALLAFIESDYRSGGVATTLHVVTPTGDAATDPETFDCDTIRAAWAPVAHWLAVACAGGADGDRDRSTANGGPTRGPGRRSRPSAGLATVRPRWSPRYTAREPSVWRSTASTRAAARRTKSPQRSGASRWGGRRRMTRGSSALMAASCSRSAGRRLVCLAGSTSGNSHSSWRRMTARSRRSTSPYRGSQCVTLRGHWTGRRSSRACRATIRTVAIGRRDARWIEPRGCRGRDPERDVDRRRRLMRVAA